MLEALVAFKAKAESANASKKLGHRNHVSLTAIPCSSHYSEPIIMTNDNRSIKEKSRSIFAAQRFFTTQPKAPTAVDTIGSMT